MQRSGQSKVHRGSDAWLVRAEIHNSMILLMILFLEHELQADALKNAASLEIRRSISMGPQPSLPRTEAQPAHDPGEAAAS